MTNAGAIADGGVVRAFARDLEAAPDFGAAMDVLHEAAGNLGFPLVDYAYFPVARMPDGEWLPADLQTRNFPRRWDTKWREHCVHDPYYHRCYERGIPIDWTEIRDNEVIVGRERDCLNYISDQVAGFGFTVPIHQPGGAFTYISMICESGDGWRAKVDRTRDTIFLIAHYFQSSAAVRNDCRRRAMPIGLSERERECLLWSARGKTAVDIGTILDLSPETVRVYLKRVNRKLNALNRSHAIAKATYLGLIDLPRLTS